MPDIHYKMRSWDDEKKEMTHFSLIDLTTPDGWKCFRYADPSKKTKDIMFFSGWQDKNKKDIYDGDIIRLIDSKGIEVIGLCTFDIHRRTMSTGYIVDISGFAFVMRDGYMPAFPIVHNYQDKHDTEIMEIIGNKYANPDLLK